MWAKTKEQIPVIVIIVLLTVGALIGNTYFLRKEAAENNARQQQEIAALKESTEARIKESNDNLRMQIAATNDLLKDAIEKRKGELFMSDDELAKLNQEKVNTLAAAIAEKIQPYGVPIPKDPAEAKAQRDQQVDEVAGRMASKIQPILEQMSHEQSLTKENIAAYSQKISDQISTVLTSELAAKQKLNNNLMETAAIAEESMRLSQEITALYLSQMKDESLFGRILTLPARVIQDTAKGSIVNSNERQKMERRLAEDMNKLQARLNAMRANLPAQPAPATGGERAAPSRP